MLLKNHHQSLSQKQKLKNPAKSKQPAKSKPKRETVMTVAKRIRKDGEKWQDALKRAKSQMGKETKKSKTAVESEMSKLKKLISEDSVLKGFNKSDIQRDAVRKAKPRGKRKTSTKGETTNQYGTFKNKVGRPYWESRENRSDRYAPSYPKNKPFLEDGGLILGGSTTLRDNGDIMPLGTANADAVFEAGGVTGQTVVNPNEAMADLTSTYGFDDVYAKGGEMKQGYNDRLNESLGNRDGAEDMMMQSYKDRRDESKGMEKAMGRRAYQSVGTMDKMAKGGKLFTADELLKKYKGKFIDTYPHYDYLTKEKKYEVRSVKSKIAENHETPEEVVYGYAKGGEMKQGYNDRLNESLGNRDGAEDMMMQSYKDRRDESKGMEKSMGRRAYQSVGTMDRNNDPDDLYGAFEKGGEVKRYGILISDSVFDENGDFIFQDDNAETGFKTEKEAYKRKAEILKQKPKANLSVYEYTTPNSMAKGGELILGGATTLRDNGDIMQLGIANSDAVFKHGGEIHEMRKEKDVDIYEEQMAKGGKTKDVIIKQMVYAQNGNTYTLDEYQKLPNEKLMDRKPLAISVAKAKLFEYNDEAFDYEDEIMDIKDVDELADFVRENNLGTAYNSYNDSWWGGVRLYVLVHNDGDKVDSDYDTLIFMSYHRGGDVRGNYEKYEAFDMQGYLMEEFPIFADRMTVTVEKGGKSITAETEDMEGYDLYINESDFDEFQEGDNTNLDDLGDELGFEAYKYYKKGGEIDAFTMSMIKGNGDITELETKDAKIKMAKGGEVKFKTFANSLPSTQDAENIKVFNTNSEKFGFVNDDFSSGVPSRIFVSKSKNSVSGKYADVDDLVVVQDKMAKGGKIGFDGLAKKVAKSYVGKKVPKKFQNQYGKTYSPAEAKEVGDKVAGAVYRMQQAKKMAKGGEIYKKGR